MKEIVKAMKESKAFIPLCVGILWSWVAAGVLTMLVILAAMLFMAYLLMNHREQNSAFQTINPVNPSNYQSRESSFTNPIPANNSHPQAQNAFSSSKSPQMSQRQTSAFKNTQSNQGRMPSSSTTTTQSSGSETRLNAGAFDAPDTLKNGN